MNGAVGDVAQGERETARAIEGGHPVSIARIGVIAEALSASAIAERPLVALAVHHSSHLHENPDADMAPSMLRVLAAVGTAFLGQSIALHCYRHSDSTPDGGIPARVSTLMPAFGSWAVECSGVGDLVLLGAGQPMQESVARDVAMQVLGALCLEHRQDAALRVCQAFIDSSDVGTVLVDPVSQLPPTVTAADVYRSGPDHEPSFTVVLTDDRGRRAEASGRSKKMAHRAAASDWLAAHAPSQKADARRAGRADPAPRPRALIHGTGHRGGVQRVREMFSIAPTDEVLLSQALIHSSWAYENQTQLRQAVQRDQRALASAGSWVLTYEYAILRSRTVDPRTGSEKSMSVPSRETNARVVRQLRLAEGLLLGRGQRTLPLSDAALEDVLQSVMAAAALSRGTAEPLLTSLPHRWSTAFVDSAAAEVDHISELERCCSALRLSPSYAVKRTGPDHAAAFLAQLTIKSELIERPITVETTESGRTMVAARQMVARWAIAVIDHAAADGALATGYEAPTEELVGFARRQLAALRDAASARGAATVDELLAEVAEGRAFCLAAGSGSRVQLLDEAAGRPEPADAPALPEPRIGETENASGGPPPPQRNGEVPGPRGATQPPPVPGLLDRTLEQGATQNGTPRGTLPDDDSAPRGARSGSARDAQAYQTFLTVNAHGDLVERVREQLGDWLRKQKSWDPPTHENSFQRGPEDQELLVLHRTSADGRDFRARLREQNPTTGTWTTNLTVHVDSDGDRAWVGLGVTNSQGRFVQRPRLASFLIDALEARDGDTWLASAPRRVSMAEVESFAEELSNVERQGLYFVAGTEAGERSLADFQDRVAEWTNGTVGLAQVAVLDPEATEAFADIMGGHHRVPAWTIRTFKPRVDPAIEEDGRRHRILGASRLATEPKHAIRDLLSRVARRHTVERPQPRRFVAVDQALTRLEDRLLVRELGGDVEPAPASAGPAEHDEAPDLRLQRLAERDLPGEVADQVPADVPAEAEQYLAQIELTKAVLDVEELSPHVLDELARFVALGRRSIAATERLTRELENRRQRLETLNDEVDYYQELNDEHELSLAETAEDLDRARDENRWLRARLRELEDYDTAASSLPPSEITDYPDDFSELADRIEQGLLPGVVFTGSIKVVRALDEHDPVGRIAHSTWDALLALSDYVRARATDECTRGIKGYLENTPHGFRGVPLKRFAEGESGQTMQAFGEERIFPVPLEVTESGYAVMAPHFKLGKVGMVSPRMHLLDDWSRTGKVYVGYIGAHRRNTHTN